MVLSLLCNTNVFFIMDRLMEEMWVKVNNLSVIQSELDFQIRIYGSTNVRFVN